MATPTTIEVIENRRADPDGHSTLLEVRRGTLTITIQPSDVGFTVFAVRASSGGGCWTERAIPRDTLDEAAATARRLLRILDV